MLNGINCMKYWILSIVICICNFAILAEENRETALLGAIDIFEQEVMHDIEEVHVPGIAVVAIHNGSVVYMKGIGYKDWEHSDLITHDTRFRLASISKILTAVAIMQLWENGCIDLDAPVINYLSWFKQKDETKRWEKITIRHLLNHTSGLKKDGQIEFWSNNKLLEEGVHPSSEDMIADIINNEMVAEPGKRLKYSNLGYWVLSQIIIEYGGASGLTRDAKYINYMKENILKPLHLDDSGYIIEAQDVHKFAKPYGIFNTSTNKRCILPWIYNLGGINAGWGFYSSIKDTSKLLIWLTSALQGESTPLLKPDTIKMMTDNLVADPNSSIQYGFGLQVNNDLGYPIIGHGGWFLGYHSQLYVDAKTGTGIAIFNNAVDILMNKYRNLAFKTIGNTIQGLPPEVPSISPNIPNAIITKKNTVFSKLVGYYENIFGKLGIDENPEGVLIFDINGCKLPMYLINQSSEKIDFRLGWEAPFYYPIGEIVSFYLNTQEEVEYLTIVGTRAFPVKEK